MKGEISFDDFNKPDLVVGKVLEVSDVAGSEKLYRMTVDLGPDYGTRTIFAGVKKSHTKAKLRNKLFAFVANLAPRKMPTGESQGMMLAICLNDEPPMLLPVPKTAKPGSTLC